MVSQLFLMMKHLLMIRVLSQNLVLRLEWKKKRYLNILFSILSHEINRFIPRAELFMQVFILFRIVGVYILFTGMW